ncbi:hypothetical protein AMK59_5554 [Oryctes borbonicus]|uniref:C2HC/C3H-type domain-containing protein n=1 Tax=Oryctes borbonicus TaxID=1629725 RepID=A0A0T6B409_9SCAR|nr:hypothetical protein AMK59_5554 [Oryctes borbonicus]
MLNKLPSSLFPWKHNKTKTPMTTLAIEQHQTMEDEEAGTSLELELLPCVICGRTFLPAPLAKHTRVCERNATRKRKIFDSLKQRVEGTDLAPFHQKSYLKKSDASPLPKSEARQSKWKEKHIELVNAIRAAKGTSSSMPSTLGKRSSTTLGTPTHERCPSCDRQFGPKAFDRHVEWCKEKKTTIHKSPASVLLAKERLEARTKYKVPPLIKSRRALTREKYSPQTNSRSEAVVNAKSVSACTLDRSPSVRRSENPLNSRKSADKMADGGSGQVEQNVEKIIKEKVEKTAVDSAVKMVQSEKNLAKEVKKAGEPVKSHLNKLATNHINNNNAASNNTNDYNPFVLAERQLMELLECDDYKTTPAPPPTTVQNTPRPHTSNTANITTSKKATSKSPTQKKKTIKSANPKLQTQSRAKTNKPAVPKRASVIDPPVDFRDRLSMLTDDFDAIENMINSSYSQDDNEKMFYSKADNNSFSLNAILSQKLYSDDISIIDPRLINENDNLSIPESLHIDDSSPTLILDNSYFELGNGYDDIDHFSQNFDTKMSTIEPNFSEIKLTQSISMYDDEKFLESGNIDEFVIALSESSVDTNFTVKKSSNKNASKVKKTVKSSKLPKSVEKSNASQNSSYGYSSSAKDRKKNNLASLKRSISLLDPVQKPKPLKNKQDVQNYFNEQELKSPTKVEKGLLCGKIEAPPNTAKLPEDDLFVPKAEELFSVDDEMYEEYKKYEEMYLKEKEEKLKKEERRTSDGQSALLTASEDDDSQQQIFKMSGDSAYGSLNRKAPKVRARSTKLTPLDSQRNLAEDSPNSSSSESSPVIPSTPPSIPKMSKFCHECGNRYPVNSAKFCVECGVKRLVL